MSVVNDGIHCTCPPRFDPGCDAQGRPLPKLFYEHRIELLQALSARLPLAHWQATSDNDIGLMVQEWLVNLLDNLSFYNDQWTREQHLNTALLNASLRQLAMLTGYQPRPNLASTAELAVIADATAPVVVPAGVAVNSEGGGGIPALTFETTTEATVDPARNAMSAVVPRETTFKSGFIAVGGNFRNMRIEEPIAFTHPDLSSPRIVHLDEIANDKFPNGEPFAELKVTAPSGTSLHVFNGKPLSEMRVKSFSSKLDGESVQGFKIKIPGVHPGLRANQHIALVDAEDGSLWPRKITSVEYVNESLIDGASPPVLAPYTKLSLNFYVYNARPFTVFYNSQRGAHLIGAPKTHTTLGDFSGRIELEEKYLGELTDYSGTFVVTDAKKESVAIQASLDVNQNSRRAALDVTEVDDPSKVLTAPLTVHGNFIEVDQGTTANETLGSTTGRRFQEFRLGQKPLTFLRQSDSDPLPAIDVYVDNVRWTHQPHLYNVSPDDRIYTLRIEADGQAHVILGGVAKPGVKNVVARYRFGTTGDNPGAQKIKKPDGRIPGVSKLFNPFAALGGLKGDTAEDLRFNLPARISGNDRCVSAPDYAVMARTFGALSATARPYWNAHRKRFAVEVLVIFDGGLSTALADKLRAYLTDHAPEASLVDVTGALPAPRTIAMTLRAEDGQDPEAIKRQLTDIYLHEYTGLLAPQKIRIGHAYSRTDILAPLVRLKGISRVERLVLNGSETDPTLSLQAEEYLEPTLELEVLR